MFSEANGADAYKPVAVRLAEDVVDKIRKGIYVDNIPSVRALAKEHQVNFKTANRALSLLTKEKVLDCKRGRRASVAPGGKEIAIRLRRGNQSEKLVLFFTPHASDLYGDLYNQTTALLNRNGYFPVVISDGDQDAMLDQVLELRPAALVVNRGWDQFPYDKVEEIAASGVRVVFQQRAEFEQSLPADYVLSDTFHGAYVATRHLLGLGHRRILHLTYQPLPVPPPAVYPQTERALQTQGYRLALEEAGLSDHELLLRETGDEAEDQRKLEALLSGPGRPTAIFAVSDHRILRRWRTIRSLGLAVPGDLALVGFFDTPGCQHCETPLSSVSLNVAELARHTVGCITAADKQPRRIVVKPELVIRESSRGGQ